MKYFICTLDSRDGNTTSLGIPASHTEQIIPTRPEFLVEPKADKETKDTYLSIPSLFKLKDPSAPHGLVLKGPGPGSIVLLVPRIEVEREIPDQDIHSLPQGLEQMLDLCRGASLSPQGLVLILDSEKFMESGE